LKRPGAISAVAVKVLSIIETAKLNGLEPYAYLRHLFENLPLARTRDDVKELMPEKKMYQEVLGGDAGG